MSTPPFTSTRAYASLAGGFIETTSEYEILRQRIQDTIFQVLASFDDLEKTSFLAVIASKIGSILFWTELTGTVQRVGEVFFIALLFVALLQGGLAVFQYRTNPSGELMIPPGLTVGVEMPEEESHLSPAVSQTNSSETMTGWAPSNTTSNGSRPSRYAGIIQRVNKFLWVLAPWLAPRVNFVLQRNAHLLHIGSILTLTSVFDFPQSLLRNLRPSEQSRARDNSTTVALSLAQGDAEHVVVIGDSLAVGLGTVDRFDADKRNDRPFERIERLGDPEQSMHDQPGPAFPRFLARTLAKRLQKRVTWRSAGVDGGDIGTVRTFCLGVVDEEVQGGRIPDVVVILCGANDMKYFLSNPFLKSNWPKSFRSRLTSLIKDIRSKAPHTTVIVPAIPTQMFHKNSPLNVFPLGFLVDTMLGFWDSQKKFVVDSFASHGVQYIGLTPMEINRWYHASAADDGQPPLSPGAVTLLAIDGVHPNSRCYTHWGEAIGTKLLANL